MLCEDSLFSVVIWLVFVVCGNVNVLGVVSMFGVGMGVVMDLLWEWLIVLSFVVVGF